MSNCTNSTSPFDEVEVGKISFLRCLNTTFTANPGEIRSEKGYYDLDRTEPELCPCMEVRVFLMNVKI